MEEGTPTKTEMPLKLTMWSWHEGRMAESETVARDGGGRDDRRGRQGLDPEVIVVCGQRHRHRVTARQRTTLCVFARVCVCVRAHAYVRVVWAGCLCVGGGVGGGARQCVACL